MFTATERFISSLTKMHGEHPVSTDGGTWYHQACRFLKINHHLHSSYEKSIIERTMQYLKDRTECFDKIFSFKTTENLWLSMLKEFILYYIGYVALQ